MVVVAPVDHRFNTSVGNDCDLSTFQDRHLGVCTQGGVAQARPSPNNVVHLHIVCRYRPLEHHILKVVVYPPGTTQRHSSLFGIYGSAVPEIA